MRNAYLSLQMNSASKILDAVFISFTFSYQRYDLVCNM